MLHSDRSLSFSPYSLLFRLVFAFLFLSCRIFPGVLIFGHALFIRSSQIFGGCGRQFFFYLFLLCAGGLGGRFLSGLFASGVVVLHPCSVFRSVLYSSYIQVYFSPGVCVPLWWAVVFRGCRLLYGMFSAAQPCPRFRVGKPHHVVVAVQGPPVFHCDNLQGSTSIRSAFAYWSLVLNTVVVMQWIPGTYAHRRQHKGIRFLSGPIS